MGFVFVTLLVLVLNGINVARAACPFMSGGFQEKPMTIGEVYDMSTNTLKGLMAHLPDWIVQYPDPELLTQSLDRLSEVRQTLRNNQHEALYQRDFQALVLIRVLAAIRALATGELSKAEMLLDRCATESLQVAARNPSGQNYDDLDLALTVTPFCMSKLAEVKSTTP